MRLGDSEFHVLLIGGVIVDPAGGVQHAAVTVVGELVQAGVGHQHGGITQVGGQIAQGGIQHTVGSIPTDPWASLSSSRGTPNSIRPPTPADTASAAARRSESRLC